VQRADRHLQAGRRGRWTVRDADGHGGAQRCVGQFAVQHVARFEGAGQAVGGIGQLAQSGGHAHVFLAKQHGLAPSRAPGAAFRQLDHGLAPSRVRQPHDRLAGIDHLAGFGQRFHHHAIAIGHQHRVAAGIAGDVGLGFGGAELGLAASAAALTWS
jgi:hypothetical protein